MKKIRKTLNYLLFFMFMFVISSCNETQTKTINRTKTIVIEQEVLVKKINNSKDFSIVTIDSCEYIVFNKKWSFSNAEAGYVGGITHKQNCKYCKARKIKEKLKNH